MITLNIIGFLYRHFLKPLLFLADAERVHGTMVRFGGLLGKSSFVKNVFKKTFCGRNIYLNQNVAGLNFARPVGLAAGFDYEARLTQILPALGFGWMTVGTITNKPYAGNPKPRLGRLPKSKSLMVNKGFKNLGAFETAEKLKKTRFEIPIGISIGRTNAPISQEESVKDIIQAFKIFEKSNVAHTYYELNISCPNLYGDVTFYTSRNLKKLLDAMANLHIKKPIFVKMPTSESDEKTLAMLEVITGYNLAGVIFGNLQKDRKNPLLDPEEVAKFKNGSFSGKPAQQRSNELIQLAYGTFAKKIIIVGCGGIFSAQDAYRKIRLGASLLQLITGMIYQGPQLIAEINRGLVKLLKQDGFKHISEAVGVDM